MTRQHTSVAVHCGNNSGVTRAIFRQNLTNVAQKCRAVEFGKMLKFTSNLVHYGASLHQRLEDVNDHRKHYESKTLNVCINTYILLHLPKLIYLCDLEKWYMKWLRYQQLPHLLGTGYATVGELRDRPVTSVALWMNAGAKSREHAHTHGTHSRRHADGCLPHSVPGRCRPLRLRLLGSADGSSTDS